MIIRCTKDDVSRICEIINDGARAYKGMIPDDCWNEPYMSLEDVEKQIKDGVEFFGWSENGQLLGVMGMQHKKDVTLIRHAYVRTSDRQKGIGSTLLNHLKIISAGPVLIGTWAAASWAIDFYRKHGFNLLPVDEKNMLLRTYWTISERQIETSVVLANDKWIRKSLA